MSYDIQFYFKEGGENKFPSAGEIDSYFKKNYPQISGEVGEWEYYNGVIDAEVELTYFDPNEEWEDAAEIEGFKDVGLVIGTELGVEEECGRVLTTFAIRIQNDLGLYILDPQINDQTPLKYSSETIFKKWKEENDWLTGVNKIESNL